jgi:hypothetical protein
MARTKLTTDLITKLEYYWQISSEITLADEDICDRLGLPYSQLKSWLRADAAVVRADGETDHICTIRARARASILSGYLQRHLGLLIKAEAAGDIKTAHKILCWLEVKQFPHRFNTPPQRVDPAPPEGTGSVEVSATIENGKVWESVVKSESQQAASGDPTLAAKNGS